MLTTWRADVHERHGLAARGVVVRLERVLHRERRHVDRHRHEARLVDHLHVVVDQVLLRRDQQDLHLAVVVAAAEDLEVEVHLVHVERDVLLGLPADLLVELLAAHRGKAHLLHDHRVPRHRGGDVLRLDLPVVDRLADRLGDRARVQERALHDRLGGNARDAEMRQLEAAGAALHRELDRLDRGRSDVEPDGRAGVEARKAEFHDRISPKARRRLRSGSRRRPAARWRSAHRCGSRTRDPCR